MSRTYRKDEGGRKARQDRHIQRLPHKACRTDGISVRPDYGDCSGNEYHPGRMYRLTERSHVREGMRDWQKERMSRDAGPEDDGPEAA